MKMEIRLLATPVILALALLLVAPVLSSGAAAQPAAQEPGKTKPRKSKRLAPPCPDESSKPPKAGKKKPG